MENNVRKINFWEEPDDKKIELFNKIKKEKNVSPKAAEKDWWVCHVIQALFQVRCADALTFKGGTSLSKSWGITERFSEDVDISFDKSFFGLTGETRSARDRIRKLTRKYIYEQLRGEFASTLWVYSANQFDVGYVPRRDSDADPTVLVVDYRSVLPKDPYIKESVRIEFSSRSLREPREIREIRPFAAELSPFIDFDTTAVPTVIPTRTCLEKFFLLHEEFQKDYPRHRRMSRHLYDLWRLEESGWLDKALADKDLYDSLVHHRSIFNAVRGIDYANHTPDKLNIIPPEDKLPLWEEDYRFMQDQFIYGESPSWPELLKCLQSIQKRLRRIG
ncbi:MAG: nucleotidyl transferase AbiEii/AbiGii toxin family protein [Bacteroidales bacterium]|nr:nucleotidyl transferase AbiEii/AbiGii toxin family protein [Bacteroidales bacterium]